MIASADPAVILALATFAIIALGIAAVIIHDALVPLEEDAPPLTATELALLRREAAAREQRTLDNLHSFSERSEWANGVARAKTRAFLPDGHDSRLNR